MTVAVFEQVDVPADALEFIAENISTNIRELEGALAPPEELLVLPAGNIGEGRGTVVPKESVGAVIDQVEVKVTVVIHIAPTGSN